MMNTTKVKPYSQDRRGLSYEGYGFRNISENKNVANNLQHTFLTSKIQTTYKMIHQYKKQKKIAQ